MAYEDWEGAEKSVPLGDFNGLQGNPLAADPTSSAEQNRNWKTGTFGPDARIIDELARVRRLNRPPRRGLIYFDFKANRVAIAVVLP